MEKFLRVGPRVWLYRALVLGVIAFTVVSFTMPWWTVDVKVGNNWTGVQIYGFGLRHNLVNLAEYLAEDETPFYQTALAWGFVGLVSIAFLWSIFIKGWKGRLLIGTAGLAYAAYAAVAVFFVVANRVGHFNIAFLGWSTDVYDQIQTIDVTYFASIDKGYYLANAAAGLAIILAIMRTVIDGQKK